MEVYGSSPATLSTTVGEKEDGGLAMIIEVLVAAVVPVVVLVLPPVVGTRVLVPRVEAIAEWQQQLQCP